MFLMRAFAQMREISNFLSLRYLWKVVFLSEAAKVMQKSGITPPTLIRRTNGIGEILPKISAATSLTV